MTRPSSLRALAAGVLVALLVASAASLQAVREVRYPAGAPLADSLYVTSGPAVRRLAVGYSALASDLYWIRAIQYYGGTKLKLPAGGDAAQEAYPSLYPMLDLTTTLDPRFNIAYRFGAIFLAEPYPAGAGRPDLALALLEKGLRETPDKWEYMQDAGFVHYWWRQDYRAAADWFRRGSEVPGAPWWLKSLAASTVAQGGDRRSSRLMWQSLRESAEIDWLRSDADRRLLQLDALDQIDSLQAALARAAANGIAPLTWAGLARARVLPGVPVDPTGVPYAIDDAGRVALSPTSTLFPLPAEPERLAPLP